MPRPPQAPRPQGAQPAPGLAGYWPERAAFTAALRPRVESGRGQDRVVLAFLTAVKG